MIPINIINLDKDTSRWDKIVEDLTCKGVRQQEIQRLPAVYGKQLTVDQLKKQATMLGRIFCTPGMIGCYLSHVKFWQKVDAESHKHQIVLEDDAEVCCGFIQVAQGLVDELEVTNAKDEWDVLLLGAFCCVHPRGRFGLQRFQGWLLGGLRTPRRISEHIHIPRRPLGTHGYILSKRGAQKLLERFPRACYHVDVVAWGLADLNVYLADPMCVFQRDDAGSTIGEVSENERRYIPHWTLDNYTKGRAFLLSIGRGLAIVFSGGMSCLFREAPVQALLVWVGSLAVITSTFFRMMRHAGTQVPDSKKVV